MLLQNTISSNKVKKSLLRFQQEGCFCYSRRGSLIFFIILSISKIYGQQVTLQGKVVNQNEQPVEFVYISLLKNDILSANIVMTDSLGNFSINAEKGDYILKLEQFGQELLKREISLIQDTVLQPLNVDESIQLEGITITARKMIIERKVDRLVFNVENSISASGGNALDALRATPMVRIQNESISIIGKGAVLVMIDDRLLRLSADDLSNLLKSIPSDNIKSIEVITTPPAKYDAEGNNGLINIKLKTAGTDSWNGYIGTSYIQKTYASGNLHGLFNYNHNKLSLQTSISTGIQKQLIISDNNIFYPDELWALNVENKTNNRNINVSFSSDYKINENWLTGVKYLGNFTDNISENNPFTVRTNNDSKAINSYISSEVNSSYKPDMNSLNWFNTYKLDSLGKKITMDFDYFSYKKRDYSYFSGNELDERQEVIPSTFFSSTNTNNNRIENYSGKADIEMPLSWASLTFGGKYSYTRTDNDLVVFDNETGIPVLNTDQSNTFIYKEYNEALYFSISKRFNGKWNSQVGLRMEATQTEGYSRNLNQTNNNDYIKLFPTIYLTYTHNDDHSFSLNYSRRIVRPSFNYLNPFIIRSSPFYYTEGNPFLEPMIQDIIELSYLYNQRLGINIYYNTVTGFAQRISIGDPQTNITRNVPLNYANTDLTGFSAYYILNQLNWWNSFTGFNVNYQNIKSKSEYVESIGGFNSYFYSNNEFFVNSNKTLSFALNYWIQPKGLNQIFYISTFSGLNISVKTQLANRKLVITAVFEDVLNSQRPVYEYYANEIKNSFQRYDDTRGFRLSVSYRFGNNNISKSQRSTSNEEERRRIY